MEKKTEKFYFDRNFERVILRSIVDADDKFMTWLPYLEPEYFNDRTVAYYIDQIRRTKDKHHYIPTLKILKSMASHDQTVTEEDRESLKQTAIAIRKKKSLKAERDYVLDNLKRFIKKQQYVQKLDESIELIETGDIDKLDKLFAEVVNIGNQEKAGLGLHYFQDVKDRVFNNKHRSQTYPLLIGNLDTVLRHGGMKRGETVFWLAVPGVGKTMALVHTAKAWIIQKLCGVYYTLQLTEEDIAERFDSTLSNVSINNLMTKTAKVKYNVENFGKRYGDSFIIKYMPRRKCSTDDIYYHLSSLKETGFEPDFIIVDFLNYLNPSRTSVKDTFGGRYYAGGDVAGELIALCQQERLLGATGIQARRAAANADITTMEDVAESFASVMEATLVISVNRKPEERANEEARLYIAKYTFGQDQIIIPINTNYKKGSLYRKL